ncbi:MAG: DNA-binding response regulator [Bacteroidetes bacterium]|nr:MAG: DNA-binding response regulator [Bacteroidota bacterium]
MNILIIEDEQLAAKRLIRLLKELEPQANILEVIDTVEDSIQWLKSNEADLIFMDIQLADGNSFSIFEAIDVFTPIIFSTAYDQYAIRAFEVNSIDYLLKPVKKEVLEKSLNKYKRRLGENQFVDVGRLMQAFRQEEGQSNFQQRFLVSSGDKLRSIPVEEVAYFYGQKRYVFLITKDNRKHIVDYTLGKLESLLNPRDFFRINRQFIISYQAIQHMYNYSKSKIKVELLPSSDVEAIVSADRTRNFKTWLNR